MTEGLTVTFVEEASQYGGVNEVAAVSRLMAQSLVVFGGNKCQTPGGLNKEAESASMARQKLIGGQHGLRLESEQLQPVLCGSFAPLSYAQIRRSQRS